MTYSDRIHQATPAAMDRVSRAALLNNNCSYFYPQQFLPQKTTTSFGHRMRFTPSPASIAPTSPMAEGDMPQERR
ncbi:MAG: hypothetical protein IT530_07450 [Burkholderiales bacterium]|nr:hypothetical protein [Burkholderiales bacterium]